MFSDRLGSFLLEVGWVSAAQLEEARRTQGFFGGDLGTHLLQMGFLDEARLGHALSRILGAPYVVGDKLRRIPSDVVRRVPPEVVERYRVCPFEIDGNRLRLAMANPRDALAIAAVRGATGLEVEAWVAAQHRLYAALEQYYGIEWEGRRGLTLRPPPNDAVPRSARRDSAPSERKTREDDEPKVGLDGLPLDAEVPYEEQIALHGGPLFEDDDDAGDRPVVAAKGPLGRLEEGLLLASDRDGIAHALLTFGRAHAARCALFAVQRDGVKCLAGRGRGMSTERLLRIVIPRESGTVIDAGLGSRDFYLGPVPPLPANKDLYSLLGGRLPPVVMLVPIRVKGRTAALLYLDNDADPFVNPDIPLMRRVGAKAGLAFEMLLLRGKLLEI